MVSNLVFGRLPTNPPHHWLTRCFPIISPTPSRTDSWAVGFFHPASIELPKLESLLEGLQRLGYTFADLRALQTEVRYDYRPDALTRVRTWLKVDLKMSQAQLDQRIESRFA